MKRKQIIISCFALMFSVGLVLLGVVGLPDIRLVTPNGKVFQKLRGYQFPDSFADDLARLIQSVEH